MAPLTQEERAQILQGASAAVSTVAGAALAPSVGGIASLAVAGGATPATAGTIGAISSSAIGGLAGAIFVAPIVAGIAAEIFDIDFPQISVGDVARAARFNERIRARGLEPVITTDPFTGNVLLATKDQIPILGQLAKEAALRSLPQPDTELRFQARQGLIDALAESAPARGFFERTEDIPADLRGGVFRATADSPLMFLRSTA